jgi:hypothetical protein
MCKEMKKNLKAIFLTGTFLMTILVTCSSVSADQPPGVYGKVFFLDEEENKQPLKDVDVIAQWEKMPFIKPDETKKDGKYSITDYSMEDCIVKLTFIKKGYKTVIEILDEVVSSEGIEVDDIVMEKKVKSKTCQFPLLLNFNNLLLLLLKLLKF